MTASTAQGLADDEFPFTALPTWPEDDHTSDGYVWAGELPFGWSAVYAWGSDGWDLGDPPYEVVAHFDDILGVIYGLAHYIEGDVTVRAFNSREARDAETDEIALSTWLQVGNGPREGLPARNTPAARIPARFRGPCRA